MAFDRRLGRVLLFGGDLFTDTWSWTGSTWLTMPTQSTPPVSYDPSMAFDSTRDRVVLLVDLLAAGETWEWDGLDWRLRSPSPTTNFGAIGLSFDARRSRMVCFKHDSVLGSQTWEYFAPCDTVGQGAPGGGLSLQCTSPPQRGGNFCLSFPSPLGAALLLLGRSPCLYPSVTVDPPVLCTRSYLHAPPTVVVPLAGNPAAPCFALPNDPVLFGQGFCLQGFALQGGACLLATDAVVATVQ